MTNNYRQDQLNAAIEKVRSGELTCYRAALVYNVPRTTIDNHIQGHSRSHQRGRPSFFTREQEQNIICNTYFNFIKNEIN
jgi:hypothetical protein